MSAATPPHDAPSKRRALRRVTGLLARAAVEQRRPQGLPRSPREVDAAWLTGALCRGVPGAQVTGIRRLDRSVGTTTRERIEVTYNAPGAAAGLPAQLFVKSTSRLPQRIMLGLGGFIECEARFYNEIRPLLEIEAPAGYFASADPGAWQAIVVIEDVVGARRATFWSPGTRLTRLQIEDLLANAAAWHGELWTSPRLPRLPWLRTPAQHMALIDALIGLADRTRAGARRASPVIPGPLRSRADDLFIGLRRSMRLLSTGPWTYLHGDLHIANTYATAAGRMGIADWQVGLRGSWAFDVGCLLATGLETADRRAWERELLDHYLERLTEAVAGAGGDAVPTREAAWTSYRYAMLYPYFAWLYTLGRSRLQPRFQPDEVSLMMIERIAAAIVDLDSLGSVGL